MNKCNSILRALRLFDNAGFAAIVTHVGGFRF
jgi:hypothetical protein